METRANYVLIGVFTILGALGALLFLLWLAKVEVDRQFAYYDVLFDNVSGLSEAGQVRYNGLPIGQVVDLALDDDDPSKVRVRLEVQADIPIKDDTIARLQVQGVTGVSFVALSGGSVDSAILENGGEIEAKRSVLDSVMEGAPQLLEQALVLLENLNEVVDDTNRDQVSAILNNLSNASNRLDGVLEDFEGLSGDLSLAAREIAGFTGRLETLAETAETTLTTATTTFETGTQTLARVDRTLDTINSTIETDVTAAVSDVRETARTATRVIDQVGQDVADVSGVIDQLANEGRTAVQRATETLETATSTLGDISETMETAQVTMSTATTTLETAQGTLETADAAFSSATQMIETSIAQTLADFRTAAQTANDVIAQVGQEMSGVAEVFADIRTTAQTADRVLSQVGQDASNVADELELLINDGRLAVARASDTFENANATLTDISRAMDTADETLVAAGQTFDSINTVIEEDIDVIVADLRGAMQAFTTTVEGASADIDRISDEVLAAARSASSFVGNLDGVVTENRRQVSDFLRIGLPEFSRFIEESRLLVRNMERLVDRIERDPARFLLGTQNSEFRR